MSGARSYGDVDAAFLERLEAGVVESRTHVEQMAMSQWRLLERVSPVLAEKVPDLDARPFIARLRTVGSLLREVAPPAGGDAPVSWVSDTVRGWLAMSVVSDDVPGTIWALLPFAQDHHFAVREWAWLAARPLAVERTEEVLRCVAELGSSEEPFVRRFAVELTRPRSVWGSHIELLKRDPELAASLLERVRCDPSPYVRTSVANWLNDAARSRPGWAVATGASWTRRCECPRTAWIVARGLRSVRPATADQIGG